MIGEYIRGYHHLLRKSKQYEPLKILCRRKDGHLFFGEVILSKDKTDVIFFQNLLSNKRPNIDDKIYSELRERYCNCCVLDGDKIMSKFGDEFILLPKQIEDDYIKFVEQNKKRFSNLPSITSIECLNIYVYIFANNSPNMFHWALNNFYKGNISLYSIKHILYWVNNYPQLVQFLKKRTVTAYNNSNEIFDLIDEMVLLQKRKRVNDVINMFNTMQKKLLKQIEITDEIINIFSKFFVLSNAKKINFIRKVSTFDNPNEIINAMKALVKTHFIWDITSFKEFISNDDIHCSIVFEKNNVIVIHVDDYDSIKHIAKTTNWCISKNKKYWNDYVERYRGDSKQYVLLDFNKEEDDELSIIGFTIINKNGIRNAHSFTNVNLMGQKEDTTLQSFIPHANNIYSILKHYDIDINSLLDCNDERYKWDHKSFLTYINNVENDGYDIVYDDGVKLAFITNDNKLFCNIMPHNNPLNGLTSLEPDKCLIFADFSRNSNDPNRLHMAIIGKNRITKDEEAKFVTNYIGNENSINKFENLLIEYHLPYNIIRRSKNVFSYFLNMLKMFNIQEVSKLLENNDLIQILCDKKNKEGRYLQDYVNTSLFSFHSNDLLKAIYDHVKLSKIVPNNLLTDTICGVLSNIMDIYFEHNSNPFDESKHLKHNYEYLQKGYLESLKIIMSHEDICINRNIMRYIYDNGSLSIVHRELSKIIMPNIMQNTTSIKTLLDFIIANDFVDIMQQLFSFIDYSNKDFICEYMLSHLKSNHPMYNEFMRFSSEVLVHCTV